MSRLDGLRHRLYVLLKGDAYDAEIRRELRFHRELDTLAQERSSLGNETYHREEVRQMTTLAWFDRIRQDLRYAIRGLRRSPAFTVLVVVTLGLGVGVNAAMFSLLSRIYVVPPAGIAHPSEVRRIYAHFLNSPGQRIVSPQLQFLQFAAMRASVDSSIALGLVVPPDSATIRDGTTRHPVRVSYVNSSFFGTLGVRPSLGRFFATAEDPVSTPAPVIVLSDALWRRAFDADRAILGKNIKLGARDVTVIGVAARDFSGIDVDAAEAWLPLNMYEGQGSYNRMPWYKAFGGDLHVIARPRNVSQEQQIILAGTNAIRPVRVPGWAYDSTITLSAGPLLEGLGPLTPTSNMVVARRIAGVVIIVLLLAAANITNLLLLRTARRGRELAVRRALGVSAMRLFEQIAVEAIFIALGGAAAALLCAMWAGTALRRLMLPEVNWAHAVLDARTVTLIAAMSIALALLCVIAPTLEAWRSDVISSLRAGGTNGAGRGSRIRATLLAVQISLCVVLLVGAGLFLRSLDNVLSVGNGFDVAHRIFLWPAFDAPSAHGVELRTALPAATQRLRAIDGVLGAAYMNHAPIVARSYRPMFLPGRDSVPRLLGGAGTPSMTAVSPGFFDAVGLRLVAGRDFTTADREGAAPVMIVSRRLAALFWPGENPLGKCVVIGRQGAPCSGVVGIADDTHQRSIIELPAMQYYQPIAQTGDEPAEIVVHFRAGREAAVVRAADGILRPLVNDMVLVSSRRFDRMNERELRPWRLGATLFSAISILALVVASVGVYSVVAYAASQRTREMGVRIALGAQRANILDLVVGDGLRGVAIGAAAGVVASLLLGRLIESFLFGVDPRDPSVYLSAAIVLIVVAVVACVVPAWRASSVSPVDALRAD